MLSLENRFREHLEKMRNCSRNYDERESLEKSLKSVGAHGLLASAITKQETILYAGGGSDLLTKAFSDMGFDIVGSFKIGGLVVRKYGGNLIVYPVAQPSKIASRYKIPMTQIDFESYHDGRPARKAFILESFTDEGVRELRRKRGLEISDAPLVWGPRKRSRDYKRLAKKTNLYGEKETLQFLRDVDLEFYDVYSPVVRIGKKVVCGQLNNPKTHNFHQVAAEIVKKIQ